MTSKLLKKPNKNLFNRFRRLSPRPFQISGLILIGLAVALFFFTLNDSKWQVALLPLSLFLAAALYCLIKDHLLQTVMTKPSASPRHPDRSRLNESLRLALWGGSFIAFLFWGLNGGWSIAWTILLATGLIEWAGDKVTARRRIK